MIRINQLKLPVNHTPEALKQKAAKALKLDPAAIGEVKVRRQSLDARKKPELFYSYTVDVRLAGDGSPRKEGKRPETEGKRPEKSEALSEVAGKRPEKNETLPEVAGKRPETEEKLRKAEQKAVSRAKNPQVLLYTEPEYRFPEAGKTPLAHPPVIIGTGPAGLFCGLMLACHGYRPILLERGEDVDTRRKKVDDFWNTGTLDMRSNVQFGEGGAGTFSDGKLNTLVKDAAKRNQLVLETFCRFGADPEILYQSKPHIGTDVLEGIVKNIRSEIIKLGGTVRFRCQVKDFVIRDGRIQAVVTETGERIPAETVVIAIGHSARDTFAVLDARGIPMSQKAFAVGVRVQHPQAMINRSQYGREDAGNLGAASYKLTKQTGAGRGVYSFCMCPGGYVVNASSEPGRLAVNGMSYHDRAGINANSALIVTVTPEDFPDASPLAGVHFQQKLEEAAYRAGGGNIPVQLYEDFRARRISSRLGDIEPQMKGAWAFSDLRQVLPEPLSQALMEGMEGFGQMIHGFDRPDAVFAGIESRTSSPVRIWRGELMESAVGGIYPCGEGAGYAGGITSAAMDGIKTAEAIAARYGRPRE